MLVSLKITMGESKGDQGKLKGANKSLRGVKRSQDVSRLVKGIQEDLSQNESRGKGVQRKLRDG